jgi:chromosomal replication initiation ATPase DnaA
MRSTAGKKPNAMSQAHLDFGTPNYAAEAFLVSEETAAARAALDQWRTWPGGVFCLFGEMGSGKSHLGAIWAEKASSHVLKGPDLSLQFAEAPAAAGKLILLIDEADQADETALFALLSRLEREGGAVLLLSRQPPSQWPFGLADLQSRLKAIATESLKAPEQKLLAQLIVRYAAAKGFKLDESSATYLAARIPRTFEAAKAVSTCLETVATSSLKTPMALAQRALRALYPNDWTDGQAQSGDLFEA